MKVVCSWCDKDLGEKEPFDDPVISHGMCDGCRDEMRREIQERRKRKAA